MPVNSRDLQCFFPTRKTSVRQSFFHAFLAVPHCEAYFTKMNTSRHYDLIILGGGSAGYAAARTAAAEGLKTVVVDGAEELGGLCILRGCMPSKTLIESGNRNLTIRHASDFGLRATADSPNISAVRDRKRRLIHEFASYRQEQLQDGRFDLIRGMGSFSSTTEEKIEIHINLRDGGTETITGAYVVIATGSVISPPPIPGLSETGFWTSDTILDAEDLPNSFIVLGGGAIALEMAHYLDGMGRKTSVIQRSPQLLSGMDLDIAQTLEQAFVERGLEIHTGTKIKNIEKLPNGRKKVTFEKGGNIQSVEAAEILFALGRKPATASLNLTAAGVKQKESGHIEVTTSQQSSHPRIFAAGDNCSPLEVVHLAVSQGETAAKNIIQLSKGEKTTHVMDYRVKMLGIFTEPQVAIAGISEKEAEESGTPYISASHPFNDHGKSMVMGIQHGFVKLIASPNDGKLLGAAVIGPEATELIHQMAIAIHLGASAADILTAPFYHPTLSEIWSYPLEEIADTIQ